MLSSPMRILVRFRFLLSSSFLIAVLVVFHAVGLTGIIFNIYKDLCLSLSPLNLLLSCSIMILVRREKRALFILFLVISYSIGFLTELVGTKTGYLFGTYRYGANLGVKLVGVPLLIGCNWFMLTVVTASAANRLELPNSYKIPLAALLMVGLDILIEPLASKLDYWHWKNDEIPLFNYVCWYFIGVLLQFFYTKLKLVETNKVFDALLLIMISFFSILNFYF